MGLLQPHGRHRRGDGEIAVSLVSCPGRGAAPFALLRRAGTHPPATDVTMGPGFAAHRFALRSARDKSQMTKSFRTLDDVDVKGKRVLLRVDLNVPTDNGRVTDATRFERVAPTITEISSKGGKVILLA